MNVKEIVLTIFEENGVNPTDKQALIDVDSVQYISIIVEIEQTLDIVMPDYILSQNEFVDIESFIDLLKNLYEDKELCSNNAMLLNENIDNA